MRLLFACHRKHRPPSAVCATFSSRRTAQPVAQIPEILPDEVLAKMHAAPKADVPIADVHDITQYDGFIFGFPTRCALGLGGAHCCVCLHSNIRFRRWPRLVPEHSNNNTVLTCPKKVKNVVTIVAYPSMAQHKPGMVKTPWKQTTGKHSTIHEIAAGFASSACP